MEKVITEFFEEQSFTYSKNHSEDGNTYFTMGIQNKDNIYHIVFEYDFEEKYFAITAVNSRKLSSKYRKKVLKIYNNFAQGQSPVVHIFTQHGMVASKYNYELVEEKLTKKRIDFMLSTVLTDVSQMYIYLKKAVKKSKKLDKKQNIKGKDVRNQIK